MLVVFRGLPGTGKTTIARALAREMGAVYVRIDSIEQAMRDAGWRVEGEGYRVAQAIAEDNLRQGQTVIADCVNPWPLTRVEWRAVASRAGTGCLDVETICSDTDEHRRRVESRSDITGHLLPSWEDVLARDYKPGDTDRLVIDTATVSVETAVRQIVERLKSMANI